MVAVVSVITAISNIRVCDQRTRTACFTVDQGSFSQQGGEFFRDSDVTAITKLFLNMAGQQKYSSYRQSLVEQLDPGAQFTKYLTTILR